MLALVQLEGGTSFATATSLPACDKKEVQTSCCTVDWRRQNFGPATPNSAPASFSLEVKVTSGAEASLSG